MGSYGGIPGEVEEAEHGDGPAPGVPGSEDDLEIGKRMRITCCRPWAALRQRSRVDLSAPGAAGPLGPGSSPPTDLGPWAARGCSHWGSPALSCGTERTERHVKETGPPRR